MGVGMDESMASQQVSDRLISSSVSSVLCVVDDITDPVMVQRCAGLTAVFTNNTCLTQVCRPVLLSTHTHSHLTFHFHVPVNLRQQDL